VLRKKASNPKNPYGGVALFAKKKRRKTSEELTEFLSLQKPTFAESGESL